jgi:hypothetical protein
MNYVQRLKAERDEANHKLENATAETSMLRNYLDAVQHGGQKSFLVPVAEVKNFVRRIEISLK